MNTENLLTLLIKEPNPFYSAGDEDFFFQWLQSNSAVKQVIRKKGLEIMIATPIDDYSLRELIGLFTRYRVDLRGLKSLMTPENASWFNNKKMFWYKSIFEDIPL